MAPPVDLDQLIKLVRDRSDTTEPLALVQSAVDVAEDVGAISDSMVSHFVEQARLAGHSWSEVGDALGVSKQAVHHRFVTQAQRIPAYGRFTGRAKTAVDNAQAEARAMQHDQIDTEHLLLGIVRDKDGLASAVLGDHGVDPDGVRERIGALVERGPKRVAGELPLAPRAHGALERTLGEALRLGHNYVGTEHVLLALYAEKEGVASKVMQELGIKKKADLERTIVARLTAYIASKKA